MDTVFGRATILNQARQTDGIVEVQLIGWTLANGANPTMYTIPSATTFTTTTSATTSSPLNPDYNLTTGSSKSTPPQTVLLQFLNLWWERSHARMEQMQSFSQAISA